MTPAVLGLAVLLADVTTPAASRPVIFEPLANGYRVVLSRDAAERLRDALNRIDDEKALAEQVREAAKQFPPAADGTPDPTAARLELLAVGLSGHLPQLKKALATKIGPNGATVRVFGLVKGPPADPRRPRLRRAAELAKEAMPDDLKAQVTGALVMARTTPLTFTVEPRP